MLFASPPLSSLSLLQSYRSPRSSFLPLHFFQLCPKIHTLARTLSKTPYTALLHAASTHSAGVHTSIASRNPRSYHHRPSSPPTNAPSRSRSLLMPPLLLLRELLDPGLASLLCGTIMISTARGLTRGKGKNLTVYREILELVVFF